MSAPLPAPRPPRPSFLAPSRLAVVILVQLPFLSYIVRGAFKGYRERRARAIVTRRRWRGELEASWWAPLLPSGELAPPVLLDDGMEVAALTAPVGAPDGARPMPPGAGAASLVPRSR